MARTTGMSGQRVMQLLVGFPAVMLLATPELRAAPITTDITYSTTGFVATNSSPITFNGITNGTLADFHSLNLGQFVVNLAPGAPKTFTDTQFEIDFDAPQFGKFEPDPVWGFKASYGMFTLVGRLNGTIDADGKSNVVATFDNLIMGPIGVPAAGLHVNGLPFGKSDVVFAHQLDLSSGMSGGRLTVGVFAEVVPEPSSSLVFLLGGSALGVWRLRRSGRTRRLA